MAEYGSDDGRWFVRPTSLPTLNFHQFDPHVRFSKANEYSNHGSRVHVIEIEDHRTGQTGKNSIASMGWRKDTGEITGISVNSKYRRLGIANTMLHEARSIAQEHGLTPPIHSADRTEMGDAWAKASGDKVPRKVRKTRR